MALKKETYSSKNEKAKIALFWQSWVWKTSITWTLYPKYRTIFISAENWLASIKKWQVNPRTWKEQKQQPEFVRITTKEDIEELLKPGMLKKITQEYDVVVVDTLSEISSALRRDIQSRRIKLQFDDWGIIKSKLERLLIDELVKLDKHVVILFQETSKSDWEDVMTIMADVEWSMKDQVSRHFDVLARIYTNKAWQRSIQTNNANKVIAKSRIHSINDSTPHDLSVWLDIITEENESQEEWSIIEELWTQVMSLEEAIDKSWFTNTETAKSLYKYLLSWNFSEEIKEQAIQYINNDTTKLKTQLEKEWAKKFIETIYDVN